MCNHGFVSLSLLKSSILNSASLGSTCFLVFVDTYFSLLINMYFEKKMSEDLSILYTEFLILHKNDVIICLILASVLLEADSVIFNFLHYKRPTFIGAEVK